MKTDRVAVYTSLNKTNIRRIKKDKLKERNVISELFCSSVITSRKISDIPLGDSCNSDLDVSSFTELPKKLPHKRVVITGVSLFLPAGFLKDDSLVAVVRRVSITTAYLLIIVSVLIIIGGWNLNSVNLSHSYIRDILNEITKSVCFT